MKDIEIYIETDDRGRMQIGAKDDEGNGDGYRLAGRKFCGCCPGVAAVHAVLDDDKVARIHEYLDRYDAMRRRQRAEDRDYAAQQETLNGG